MLVIEVRSDQGLENLRYAIIKQACIEYDEALTYLRGKPPSLDDEYLRMTKQKGECEAFFKSEHFAIICNLDGEILMRTIRQKYYNRPIRWSEKGE